MKKILIPTDFSPIADNALSYAIEIAAAFKSEIYLYHAYYIDRVDYRLDLPGDEQPFKRQVERKMELTKQKFMEKITQKGLSVHTIVEDELIYSLFKDKVKNHGIDLIVMGSRGATGMEKIFFGSVAAAALELSAVPVLVIPPRHSFRGLEHVVLAMDEYEVSSVLLAPLQKLAAAFAAKVIGLHVNTGVDEGIYRKMDLSLKEVETTCIEVPMSKNINRTIHEFVGKGNYDLLCMVRREKGFFKNLFQKSITKTQVYNNSIPLLVLPAYR